MGKILRQGGAKLRDSEDMCLSHLKDGGYPDKEYISGIFSQRKDATEYHTHNYSNGQKNVDLVVAGCSFTRGVGVEYHETWGENLSSKLGLDYVNISERGWSMANIADGIFSHIRRHGNPKYIAILATELTRGLEPLDTREVRSRSWKGSDARGICTVTTKTKLSKDSVSKYSKQPHFIEDVTFTDAYVYRSILSLNSLIDYCRGAGVILVWGTWDRPSRNLYRLVLADEDLGHIDLGNYIDMPVYGEKTEEPEVVQYCSDDSHVALSNIGSDNGDHSGPHYHLHWAEAFYTKLRELVAVKDSGN